MSENQKIHDRLPEHNNHPGLRSFRRAIQAIDSRWREYRMERTQAHEGGHQDAGFVGGFHPDANPYPEGVGQEIELFNSALLASGYLTPEQIDQRRIQAVRDEIRRESTDRGDGLTKPQSDTNSSDPSEA